MELFEVEVKEILSRNIIIEAETVSSAIDKAKEMCKHGEIVLDSDDLIFQGFFPYNGLMSKISLPDEYVEHLKLVIDYLEKDELKDYESNSFPRNHIFHSIMALKNILKIYK
ncbi:DpnD/PcfM family protein [Neisseria sp.]|uniref:DpnD/PcfM family protein n=1 Tax=Neisseria sp. TaxID=192066 RepID=UPI0026DAF7B9|nr:DpnD/PcfM family protein [Neisseria sp.]MDO4906417.1 DpnD/PcfM family protein [Neisseria sp.]